jgi:hypothetical protein
MTARLSSKSLDSENFAFFAESFAIFAVKDSDLRSRLKVQNSLNRKERKGPEIGA